ncbi:MAG: type II toxin-antitoxin system PemK/MazF family toxin [Defluviitaleaceae bacterium]|nr:type II toxin-antitoxin system PemK/MazF family toxin [Defluviitaleaceae bacterium]
MKPYDLHIAYVSWGDEGKRRPVLILSSEQNEVTVFPITSKFDSKSAAIKTQYVVIDDWSQAGLTKQSYIDIGRVIDLPKTAVQAAPIGRLSKNDLYKLLVAVNC